jgi:hypothetical protein
VNEEAAQRYWPHEDPLRRRIRFAESGEWFEIIGIVGNVRSSDAGSDPIPQMYVPLTQQPERTVAVVVRSDSRDPTQLMPLIRGEVAQLDKDLPVFAAASMERSC